MPENKSADVNGQKTCLDGLSRFLAFFYFYPANIYLFKVNKSNTRKKCEICSNLTIKTPEQRNWCRRFSVFIVHFEHVSHFFPVFLLLNLNINCLLGRTYLQAGIYLSKITSWRTRLICKMLLKKSIKNNRKLPRCQCPQTSLWVI